MSAFHTGEPIRAVAAPGACQFGRCLTARMGGEPMPAKFRLYPQVDDLPPGAPTFVVTCGTCLVRAIELAPCPLLVEVIR